MALFSIMGIIVLVILFLFMGRILSVAAKILFYVLIIGFIGMLIFGVSFSEMWQGFLNLITWAF